MNIILAFLFGFVSAFIGIFPPGLLNMTVVKINLKESKDLALQFIFGAIAIIFAQVLIALLFSEFVITHPKIILILRKAGCFIFGLLTIYFFLKASVFKKKVKIKKHNKKSRFFLGILLSVLNIFPVPYYIFIAVTLKSYCIFTFNLSAIFTFVLGATLGSFMVFYGYILFSGRIKNNPTFLLKNSNWFIGSVTGIVTLITLWDIFRI